MSGRKTSDVVLAKMLKRNLIQDAEKIDASASCLQEQGPSRSSMVVVNNDTTDVANPKQVELYKENIEKRDRIPNSSLQHEATAGNCTVKCYGAELIGRTVKIWWPQEKTFCRGKIKNFDSDEKLYMVDYDIGVKEFLDLSEECWQLEQETNSGPGASNTMVENVGMSSDNSKRKHMEDACQEEMTQKGKNEKVNEIELNSNEDDQVCQKNGAADSKIISQSPEHQKRQKTLADHSASSVQDGDAHKLVDVGGYLVKASIAPTLQSIFSKYGDISSECPFKLQNTRIHFLEIVCNVVKKLQSAEFGASASEVKKMMSEIADAAEAKLNVSWLQKCLEEITRIEEFSQNSSELIELRVNSNLIVKAAKKDMEDRRMEVMAAKKQFMEAENRWKALEHVKAKIENNVVEFLAPKRGWRRRVDELL